MHIYITEKQNIKNNLGIRRIGENIEQRNGGITCKYVFAPADKIANMAKRYYMEGLMSELNFTSTCVHVPASVNERQSFFTPYLYSH